VTEFSIPEPVSPNPGRELPSCTFSSKLTAAEELHLLREIVGLPMTELSPREVAPSKGSQAKVVKMLGLDGTV
jgi:hypothetical protein